MSEDAEDPCGSMNIATNRDLGEEVVNTNVIELTDASGAPLVLTANVYMRR